MRRVPGRALLRSEWAKLRSVRAFWLALTVNAAAVVVGAWTSLSGTTAPDDVRVAVAAAQETLLGAGMGALLRRTAAVAVVGTLLVAVLPVATVLAGAARVVGISWLWPTLRVGEDDILTVATRGAFGLPASGDVLLAGATDWPTGLAVTGGWALVLWALGALVTERRDA